MILRGPDLAAGMRVKWIKFSVSRKKETYDPPAVVRNLAGFLGEDDTSGRLALVYAGGMDGIFELARYKVVFR